MPFGKMLSVIIGWVNKCGSNWRPYRK